MHFEIGRRSVFALKTEDLTCKQAAGASGHRAEVRRCLRRAYDKPNWWFSRQITLKTSNFNRSLGAVSVTAYASKVK